MKTLPLFHRRLWPALLSVLVVIAPPLSAHAQGKPGDDFIKTVTAGFSIWDQNHDQTLSIAELDAAIENPANKGEAAAALAALKRASRSTNYALPPLTLANIGQLASSPPATNQPNLRRMYGQCLKTLNGVTRHELFATGLPQLDTIRQGRMGDCFCLAPLGAMIHRDPREVASLFSTQPDGSVRVQFGGGPITVAPPTDAELAMTAGNTHDGVWVNLYEKAIGEARNDQRTVDKRASLPIDAIARGGSAGKIMSYLTGHKVSNVGLKFAKDPAVAADVRTAKLAELRQKLAAAAAQKRLMACSTVKPTTPGLTPKHAYALLEYDSKTDAVQLWNPHGNNFTPKGPPGLTNGYATKKGLFTVPVSEFVQQFTGVSIEGAELAARQ